MSTKRVVIMDEFSWQQPVKAIQADAPIITPARGDRYWVDIGTTSGDPWFGHENQIAYCSNATGPVWTFVVPEAGWIIFNEANNKYYKFTGGVLTENLPPNAGSHI